MNYANNISWPNNISSSILGHVKRNKKKVLTSDVKRTGTLVFHLLDFSINPSGFQQCVLRSSFIAIRCCGTKDHVQTNAVLWFAFIRFSTMFFTASSYFLFILAFSQWWNVFLWLTMYELLHWIHLALGVLQFTGHDILSMIINGKFCIGVSNWS